jgi:hypothetical protein
MCESAFQRMFVTSWGGRCVNCDIQFNANLEFFEHPVGKECTRCKKPQRVWCKFPQCVHSVCVDCFRDIFRGVTYRSPELDVIDEEYEELSEEELNKNDEEDSWPFLPPCPDCGAVYVFQPE